MKNEEEIEDSLEFCKDIIYYQMIPKMSQEPIKDLDELEKSIREMDKELHKEYDLYRSSIQKAEKRKVDSPEEMPMHPMAEQDYSSFESVSTRDDDDFLGNKKDKEKINLGKLLIQFVSCLIVSFGLVYILTNYIITYTTVNGRSMCNTLQTGNHLIIDRISYELHDPKQMDVIVFEQMKDVYYIKRVIAVPGQTVQIIDGKVYVDGVMLEEEYANEVIRNAGLASQPIRVGKDEYFVMGDNRNHSTDSRSNSVGLVKRNQVVGRAVFRIYPFNEIGTLK